MMFDPLDTLRKIREIVRRCNDQELLTLVLALQRDIFALESENIKLNMELASLKQELGLHEKMHQRPPHSYYFRNGDDVPFCPTCWESEGKAVHLSAPDQSDYGIRRECPACRQTYWERPVGRTAKAGAG
jgi:hypothetical protein